MVIIIDVSILPENLRYIFNDIKIRKHSKDGHTQDEVKTVFDANEQDDEMIVLKIDEDKRKIHEIRQRIKDTLIKYRIKDYVVIDDEENTNKLKIVSKAHAESLGIYHCRHCGMAFENQIQLSTHQRIHYFI